MADYDPEADFRESILEGFRAVRERIANGGPAWVPKCPKEHGMLAIDGGTPCVTEPLRAYNGIGESEVIAASAAIRTGPLSGYLGGRHTGGLRVEVLEYEFAGLIGSRHAVACNSATSGLLMACAVCGVGPRSTVWTSPYTMSATAAAPKFLGAQVNFGAISTDTFTLEPMTGRDVIIPVNLFGHPAKLTEFRRLADIISTRKRRAYIIEDSAQAPFAKEGDKYAGTIGHIGVFSFNVHKHLQCGEGGICVTDDDTLADAMRRVRNHRELFSNDPGVGLNLRMTEVSAAIALAQLAKREKLIGDRIELAEEMTDMVRDIPWIRPPVVREGCTHVYYTWSLLIDSQHRDWFVRAMQAEGVPLKAGYVTPLYELPAFRSICVDSGVIEDTEQQIATFEICAYGPSSGQRQQMREAFKRVGGSYEKHMLSAGHNMPELQSTGRVG